MLVDDYCDPDQAVAAAHKLVAEGVPFVVGHQCSGAAIPASEVYEEAGIVLISPAATNPRLTDRGLRYTFRTCGRDDVQGTMVGDWIADGMAGRRCRRRPRRSGLRPGDRRGGKRRLDELGIDMALFEQVQPGQTEFSDLLATFETHGIDVVFYGGYPAEAGLIVRQAKARLPELDFVVPDGVASERLLADRRRRRRGHSDDLVHGRTCGIRPPADVVAAFKADGTDPLGPELFAYAAVQVWAQAVEQAGTTDAARIAEVLRQEQFDTVSRHHRLRPPRATSPASIRSSGTSGPTASTCQRT